MTLDIITPPLTLAEKVYISDCGKERRVITSLDIITTPPYISLGCVIRGGVKGGVIQS